LICVRVVLTFDPLIVVRGMLLSSQHFRLSVNVCICEQRRTFLALCWQVTMILPVCSSLCALVILLVVR